MMASLISVIFHGKRCYSARAVKPVLGVGLILWTGLALHGCGGRSDFRDIHQFMQQVEAETSVAIKDIPATKLYQPYAYGASNLRSPFVPPVVVPSLSESVNDSYKTGISPPKNHAKQPLEAFNIVSLQMLGTIQKGAIVWALIEAPDGRVHRVRSCGYIGMDWGKVTAINISDDRIDFIEIVSDGADGWLPRPNFIELKSASN